ncbi:MAG: NAD(P)/FAD-dependent oxidoreductase [Pseudomonadota bacterium]
MTVERVDTLVVGGGQAGLAMSAHLSRQGIAHLVLERARVAERWRSARWDSLVANGPAWHDRFPDMAYPACGPEGFPGKEAVADYFEAYARKIAAPIRCGVAVERVRRLDGRSGFIVETSEGAMEAERIVVATGPFQRPMIPPLLPADAGVAQLHSRDYRNPDALAEGAVLVVGAGSSGAQIAEELCRAGRRVFLSVGPHHRPPRRYRGRDYVWWLGVLGKWDAVAPTADTAHIAISVTGARGGRTVDFRRYAAEGVTLLGMASGYRDGAMQFAPDLAQHLAEGDANYRSVLAEADAWIAQNGGVLPGDFPEEPEAHEIPPDPPCVVAPILSLDLAEAGIATVLWATGYARDDSWLQVDAFDTAGRPDHVRGVSRAQGVYFLGLPWLSRRGSAFIWGVWHDAGYLADQIAIQRSYMAYRPVTGA